LPCILLRRQPVFVVLMKLDRSLTFRVLLAVSALELIEVFAEVAVTLISVLELVAEASKYHHSSLILPVLHSNRLSH